MFKVTKTHLKYKYSPRATPGDNPKITWKPDTTLFNRHEEYEVICLIQHIFDEHDLKQEKTVHKIEDMLKNLPSTTRSREHVISWIVDNWKKY